MNSDQLFSHLYVIGQMDKSNDKLAQLQTFPREGLFLLKRVLYQTYNPFIRYGFRTPPYYVGASRREVFTERTWKLLTALASGGLSGNKARETVSTYLGLLTPDSAELFKRILLKDLRIGVNTKTINRVFPNLIPEHDVMLCEEWREDKFIVPATISPKYNGNRGTRRGDQIYGRKGNTYRGLSHITRELKSHSITADIDGELIIPNTPFQIASGLIRNSGPTLGAVLMAFDLPNLPDMFAERTAQLRKIVSRCDFVRMVEPIMVHSIADVYAEHEKFVAMGFEGSVVKTCAHRYQVGYSFDWMKIVPEKSVDLQVVGVYQTFKRTALGQIGGVVVFHKGKRVKVGGGFSFPQLELYFREPQKIIGKTIRIVYKEVTLDGSLQHPRFDRIRHDK